MSLWRRIEEWWDRLNGIPTRSEVEAARQEWLRAQRDLDEYIEKRLRELRGDKVH